jgi:hypothetical protein
VPQPKGVHAAAAPQQRANEDPPAAAPSEELDPMYSGYAPPAGAVGGGAGGGTAHVVRGANDAVYAVPMEDAPAAVTIVQVYGSAEDNTDGAVVVAAGWEARAATSSTAVYATPIEDTPC